MTFGRVLQCFSMAPSRTVCQKLPGDLMTDAFPIADLEAKE